MRIFLVIVLFVFSLIISSALVYFLHYLKVKKLVSNEIKELSKEKEKNEENKLLKSFNSLYKCNKCSNYFRGYQYLINYFSKDGKHSCPQCNTLYSNLHDKLEPNIVLNPTYYQADIPTKNHISNNMIEVTDLAYKQALKNSVHSPEITKGSSFDSTLETIEALEKMFHERMNIKMVREVQENQEKLGKNYYSNLNENMNEMYENEHNEIKEILTPK